MSAIFEFCKSYSYDIVKNDIITYFDYNNGIYFINNIGNCMKEIIMNQWYEYLFEENYKKLIEIFNNKNNMNLPNYFNDFVVYNSIRTQEKLIRCLDRFKNYVNNYIFRKSIENLENLDNYNYY